jgi:hypothetical protein
MDPLLEAKAVIATPTERNQARGMPHPLPLLALCLAATLGHAQGVSRTFHGLRQDDPAARVDNPDRGFRLECQLGLPDGITLVMAGDKAVRRRGPLQAGDLPFPQLDLDPAKGWSDRALGESLARGRTMGLTTHLGIVWLDEFSAKPSLDPNWIRRLEGQLALFRRNGCRVILRFAYEGDRTRAHGPELATVLRHAEGLKPLLERNADVICAVQLGLIGHRGEVRDAAKVPPDLRSHAAVLKGMLAARPRGKSVQVRSAGMRAALLGELGHGSEIQPGEAFDERTPAGLVGLHNIGFGFDGTDDGTFDAVGSGDPGWLLWSRQAIWVPADADLGRGTAGNPRLADGWLVARKAAAERVVTLGVAEPMTAAPGSPGAGLLAGWAGQMKAEAEVRAMGLPVSDGYFHDAKGSPVARSALDYLRDHLGARLELRASECPSKAKPGEPFALRLRIANRGFAALPAARTLDLVFIPRSGRPLHAPGAGEDFDLRRLLPSHAVRTDAEDGSHGIVFNTQAPAAPGKYQIALVARDFEGAHDPTAAPRGPRAPLDARQCLRFANRDAVHWVSPDKTLAGPIVAEIQVTR